MKLWPLLLSGIYRFLTGQSLSSDDKCAVIAAVCFNLPTPARLTKIHSWIDPQKSAWLHCLSQQLGSHGVLLDFATDKHRTQSCPGALQWDGTGNICGLKERGRGWRGSGQRTQTGGAQTLHCARPWQMGTAKHAACFLVNRFMKEHRKDNRVLWPFNFSCQMLQRRDRFTFIFSHKTSSTVMDYTVIYTNHSLMHWILWRI